MNKPFTILNNASPTRKDNIIDLTLTSNRILHGIFNWKITEEVFFF